MFKFLKLIKVMLKTSFSQGQFSMTKRKWLNYGLIALIAVSTLPTFVLYYYAFSNLIAGLKQINQQGLVINVVVAINTILIFLTSILLLPNVYFFSKDTEYYLPLPIKPYQIISGKLVVSLLSEYLLLVITLVPALAAYFNHFPSISLLIGFILLFILLPLFPLLIASILIMIGTKYVPFMRNKNFMTMVIGFVSIVFIVGFSISMQNVAIFEDPNLLIELIQSGANSISKIMFTFLPPVKYAAEFVVDSSYWALAKLIIVSGVLMFLFLAISEKIYFSTVTNIKESSTSNKEINYQHQRQGSKDLAYLKKELRFLLRTPAYLMNNVLGAFLFPVIMFVSIFMTQSGEFQEMSAAISEFHIPNADALAFGIVLGLALGLFNGSSNMVAATAVTRDKNQVFSNLSIPFPYYRQLILKALLGTLLSLTVTMFMIIAAVAVFPKFIMVALFSIIPVFIASFAINLVSVLIDSTFPKLNWDTEMQATKNNFNGMFPLFGSWALIGLSFYLYFKLQPPMLLYASVLLVTTLLLVIIFLYLLKSKETFFKQRL